MRLIKYFLYAVVIFHVVHSTYVINTLNEKVTSINAVLLRIKNGDSNLKREAAAGLNTLEKTYQSHPHASDEFIRKLAGQ